MRLAVLFSGGKDSALALNRAARLHEICCLVTLESSNSESYMFHTPNIHLVPLLAQAMELPLVRQETKGVKEEELSDLSSAIKNARDLYGAQGIVSGTLASTYQSTRVQKICNELGLWCFNPLWMRDPLANLEELVRARFETMIVGIFAYPLEEELLGKLIDLSMVGALKKMCARYRINPSGEGGELETLVLDGPVFSSRLEVIESTVDYKNYSGVMHIQDARLVSK